MALGNRKRPSTYNAELVEQFAQGAAETSVLDPRYPIGNVRRYGAVGDGIADDYAAIQRALDSLPVNGGVLQFDPGAYMVSTTLQIKRPGVRFLGLGGHSWRSGSTGETSSSFRRAPVAIAGTTSGMTLFECNGVDNLGVTVEQAGPAFENIAFFDNIGRLANTPGNMTLVSLRLVNRWSFLRCSVNWAGTGIKADKADTDCADWSIERTGANGCVTGFDLNAYSGTLEKIWITRCGRGVLIARAGGESNPPGTIWIDKIKIDILNPIANPNYAPGIGIDIGVAQSVYIDRYSCEENGNPSAPDAIALRVQGSTSFTQVFVSRMLGQNLDYVIKFDTGRRLEVDKFTMRQADAAASAVASIAVDTCTDYAVRGARGINNTRIPFTHTANTTKAKYVGVEGDVIAGACTISDSPRHTWSGVGPTFVEDYGGNTVLSPAQIVATANNYDPDGTGFANALRLTSDASRVISGIANGRGRRALKIWNVGAQIIQIANQAAGSAAANRVITGTGATVNITADGFADLEYDPTSARWRLAGLR